MEVWESSLFLCPLPLFITLDFIRPLQASPASTSYVWAAGMLSPEGRCKVGGQQGPLALKMWTGVWIWSCDDQTINRAWLILYSSMSMSESLASLIASPCPMSLTPSRPFPALHTPHPTPHTPGPRLLSRWLREGGGRVGSGTGPPPPFLGGREEAGD